MCSKGWAVARAAHRSLLPSHTEASVSWRSLSKRTEKASLQLHLLLTPSWPLPTATPHLFYPCKAFSVWAAKHVEEALLSFLFNLQLQLSWGDATVKFLRQCFTMLLNDRSSSIHRYLSETKIEVCRYYLMVILKPQSFHYFADSRLYVLAKSYMKNDVWAVKVSLGDPEDWFFHLKRSLKKSVPSFITRDPQVGVAR